MASGHSDTHLMSVWENAIMLHVQYASHPHHTIHSICRVQMYKTNQLL